jgi:hypothetical protein
VGYRRLLSRRIAFETLLGSPSQDHLLVVVCLWDRPMRIADILRIVDAQLASTPIRLVLWNNRPVHSNEYRRAVHAFHPSGSLSSVEMFESPLNIGGIGRFVATREIVRRGYTGPFIMIDDDQNFGPGLVEALLSQSGERAIAGVWAWNNSGRYWNRTQVFTTGESAAHIGTGGSVCDSVIVTNRRFFTKIPTRFLFMEDIWMSHFGARNDWRLTMAESPFDFVMSEKDQGHAIFDRKEDFFQWLREPRHIPLERGRLSAD